MAEMIKAIKLTPHDANVHLKLSDVLSQGSIILGFPSQSDDQVKKNADNIRKVLSSQTTPDTTQGSIKIQLVDVQIKKSKFEQVKDAKDRFNAKAGPDDPTIQLIRIFTESYSHIIAVRDKDEDNRHPLYFKLKQTTGITEHDNDPSTFFVKFEYIRPPPKPQVTMFVNCHAWLPMGTIHKFEILSCIDSIRLYAYGDPNAPPPTELEYDQILSDLAQKFVERLSDQENADLVYFKINGLEDEPSKVYPSYLPTLDEKSGPGISKEFNDSQEEPNAVVSGSSIELIITRD